jgi:hypothetical protein
MSKQPLLLLVLLVLCAAAACRGPAKAQPGTWHADLGRRIFAVRLLSDGKTVVALGTGAVVAVDVKSGAALWKDSNASLYEMPAFMADGKLCLFYYGIQMFDARTGTKLWERQDYLPVGMGNGVVWAWESYQGSDFEGFYADQVVLLDAVSGTLLRRFTPRTITGYSKVRNATTNQLAVKAQDGIYLLQADGKEQRYPLENPNCSAELALVENGIICVDYLDQPLPPPSHATPVPGGTPRVALRFLSTTNGNIKWRINYSLYPDVMRDSVLRANNYYVILIKYPGIVVFDTNSGIPLYDTPQTATVSGPQWIALDQATVYWTGFNNQGYSTGLESFDVVAGQHQQLKMSISMRDLDAIIVGRQLLLLGEREPLLVGAMYAQDYILSMQLPSGAGARGVPPNP